MFIVMAKVGQGNVVLAEDRFFSLAKNAAEVEAFRLCSTVEIVDTKSARVVHTVHSN